MSRHVGQSSLPGTVQYVGWSLCVADMLTLLYVDERYLIIARQCVESYHCPSQHTIVQVMARSRSRPLSADVTTLSTVLRRTCYELTEFTQLYDAGRMFFVHLVAYCYLVYSCTKHYVQHIQHLAVFVLLHTL